MTAPGRPVVPPSPEVRAHTEQMGALARVVERARAEAMALHPSRRETGR